jgi:RNA polymerase sigma-70 factor (ECF subfamily)
MPVKSEALDTAIVRACLAGDVHRYGVLVDRYSARIINLAFMMIGDRHDAEDIAQDAFVRAYRGLPRFERRAKFSSWLYQITLNLCKDYLKAKSRHARNVEEERLESFDAAGDAQQEEAPRIVLQEELSEKMREAIRKLPYLYRETFTLRHLDNLDYDEIAEIVRVPADTIRVRAYRAREMLREQMAPAVDTFWREKALREEKVRAAKG